MRTHISPEALAKLRPPPNRRRLRCGSWLGLHYIEQLDSELLCNDYIRRVNRDIAEARGNLDADAASGQRGGYQRDPHWRSATEGFIRICKSEIAEIERHKATLASRPRSGDKSLSA